MIETSFGLIDEKRFWSKVKINSNDECWWWGGPSDKDGYGLYVFYINSKQKLVRAHRFAYELEYGCFDKDLCVLHSCDKPDCCNPTHLWLGTVKDNNMDALRKNRTAKGIKNGHYTCPDKTMKGNKHYYHLHPGLLRGEKNPNAKLTWAEINEIRASSEKQQALADKYGVSNENISNIKRNKSWKHVP